MRLTKGRQWGAGGGRTAKRQAPRWRRSLSLSRVSIPPLSRHEPAAITPHSGAPFEGGVVGARQPGLSYISFREFWMGWERKAARTCERSGEKKCNFLLRVTTGGSWDDEQKLSAAASPGELTCRLLHLLNHLWASLFILDFGFCNRR